MKPRMLIILFYTKCSSDKGHTYSATESWIGMTALPCIGLHPPKRAALRGGRPTRSLDRDLSFSSDCVLADFFLFLLSSDWAVGDLFFLICKIKGWTLWLWIYTSTLTFDDSKGIVLLTYVFSFSSFLIQDL